MYLSQSLLSNSRSETFATDITSFGLCGHQTSLHRLSNLVRRSSSPSKKPSPWVNSATSPKPIGSYLTKLPKQTSATSTPHIQALPTTNIILLMAPTGPRWTFHRQALYESLGTHLAIRRHRRQAEAPQELSEDHSVSSIQSSERGCEKRFRESHEKKNRSHVTAVWAVETIVKPVR